MSDIAGTNTLPNRSVNAAHSYRMALWVCTFGLLTVLGLFAEQARAAAADESAKEAKVWLDKISSSAKAVSYEGTFIFRRDDQLVTMHLVHVVDGMGERERLSSVSGVPREFFRSKEGVVCLTPGQRRITINKGSLTRNFPAQLAGGMQDLEKNYHLLMGDKDRIAGRSAQMVVIEPKDNYRYGYRIWVDEKTGLLLQSDLVNGRGNAVEQFMFTSLNVVDKPTPKMVQAVTMSDKMRKALKMSKPNTMPVADVRWRIMNMPSGFSLVERYQHKRAKRGPVEQLVLTDGMATVSVFVEQLGRHARPFNGVSHVGAVNAYGAVVNNHQLTVVGEVPLATVRLIGKSLRLSTAGH
ncbi:MAG: MucB/RseB C-terminal domain-containing protein [Gammaproteobacteria bacterium]|jgi:sigma-E factor negative regulatory protein RseB